jgi:hypothetical protein
MLRCVAVLWAPALPQRTAPWETQWGQLNGPLGCSPQLVAGDVKGRACFVQAPTCLTQFHPPSGGFSRGGPVGAPCEFRTVTWLILPVVICLSQRLSHACLSISTYTVKLRMAH